MNSQYNIEIETELNRDDFKEFNKYVAKHIKPHKIQRLIGIGFVFIVVLLFNINKLSDIKHMVIQFVIISIIYWLAVIILNPLFIFITKYVPMKNGAILGKHIYKISNEGLWEIQENHQNLTKWNGVKSIKDNKKYIYVFVDNNMAHIIPKRYFDSLDESEHFITDLKARINKILIVGGGTVLNC